MKILYIHQYFLTPEQPGGTRSYWLAKELIKKGHSVTILTSSVKFDNKIHKVNIDGIDVIYIKEAYSQKMSFLKRIISFFSFMVKSTFIGLKQKNVDLVFATSTPLTIGVPALILKRIKKIPYVFEVRDLWPEVPIQMGGLNNLILKKIAIMLEKVIYKNSKHIIALSPGMAEGVLKYESKDKISVIPNMAKIDKFWPRAFNNDLRKELGLKKNTFKIIHFGALGLANDAMNIIKGAELLKDDFSVEFVFVGGGSQEEDLRIYCTKKGLKNVHFFGSFPMNKTSEVVNLCDVSIVSFKNLPILYTNSPNKLFDSLSAGKPIIVNSAGWTKDMVEENNCGYFVNPDNAKDLKYRIKFLQKNSQVTKEMGMNSRKLAVEKYDKGILCNEFVSIIENL